MKLKTFTTRALVAFLITAQVSFGLAALFTPKPAQAFLGVADVTFNTQVGNIWQDVKDVALGAAQRIAIQYANKYLQKFVDKLVDKYRIKDYLAYDKVLSGYYLNQYIYKNVDDPDLRAIYGILATDVNTRATATDANGKTVPVLTALREKLDTYYYNQGGIQQSLITNPGASVTDEQYFAAAQAYFANPPSFSDQQLYGQFGQMVSDSEKASSQEIANSAGTGFKNDRSTPAGTVPYICQFSGPLPSGTPNPRDSEANCNAVGGTWKIDANGIASSVIQNPAGFVHDFATSAINSIFTDNFGITNNLYTTIGSLLGNFIFTKLNLTSSTGTFNETGSSYVPPAITDTSLSIQGIDIDGDGIPDGQDADGDGQPDFCIYGGIPVTDPATGAVQYSPGPPCLGSKAALTVTPPPAPVACTSQGSDEQNYLLDLLNNQGKDAQTAVDMTNAQFNLGTGNSGVYYQNNNTIGFPEFYAAGPTTGRPVSPATGLPWDIVTRCSSGGGGGGGGSNAHSNPDQTGAVATAKASVVADGINPSSSDCAAFEITRRTAIAVGAGVLKKGGGAGCQTTVGLFSVDKIVYLNGDIIDILGDGGAGGQNTPSWQGDGTTTGCSTSCSYVDPNTVPPQS